MEEEIKEPTDWVEPIRQTTRNTVIAKLALELERHLPDFSVKDFRQNLLDRTEKPPKNIPENMHNVLRTIQQQVIIEMLSSSTYDDEPPSVRLR